ncbi:Sodium/sulphate symporter [Ostreococcus tauri]|uniref:Sodium/sulphate symporter n=2 Tax=Ostreococcus tauri TaxID=70448 RepID=A0A090N387_OSTTA|nr:Sodium/sulphate symporter [Ostreococcus tauri]CEF97688.1 Sodium/sulphate symporter [Ostreococcus tauri]|eukprot:XP_022838830.1 Sodium/sulphate symporter [Ostreococcus tauri]
MGSTIERESGGDGVGGGVKTTRAVVMEADDLRVVNACVAIGVGVALKWGVGCPAALEPQAWNLLSIFVSTVTGLVLKPMPIGAWAFGALTVALSTKTLTFVQGLSAITNEVVWLIVVTGFFARAFIKTGFGDRLALLFVSVAGHTTLSLAYGFQVAEALLSPAMPSTTARAAGVFVPVIKSLDKRTREYLIGQQIQGTSPTSTFLLSGAAQNFLAMQIALASGIPFSNPFNAWFVAASVPALVSLLATPMCVFMLDPPGLNETPEAPLAAAQRLSELGPLSSIEKKMVLSLSITVFLWVFGVQLGISAVVSAMIGMCFMLMFGVLSWDEALGQKGSWDTLIWFAVLVGFSGQLNAMGVVGWLSGFVSNYLVAQNLGMWGMFGALHCFYFFLHYFFASQSAHVGALYPAFLTLLLAAGVPPPLAALSLAFNTNNMGGLTHYASGQAAVYYGSGEISLRKLWKQGLYMSAVNFAIYGTVGMAWWKVIGLY